MRYALLAAAAVVLLTPSAAAAAESRFDLVCRGEGKDNPLGPTRAYEVRYRVDLDALRWCEGACEEPAKIQEVTPDRITFFDQHPPGRSAARFAYVSRQTGAHGEMDADRYSYRIRDGKCDVAPFTGMPAAKF